MVNGAGPTEGERRDGRALAGWVVVFLALAVLARFGVSYPSECARQGYSLWPPSANAIGVARGLAEGAILVVLAALLVVVLPWQRWGGTEGGRAAVGRAWAILSALAGWAVWGYRVNRFDFGALWRRTESIGALELPTALLDQRVWWVNLGLTLAAAMVAMALMRWLGRSLPRVRLRPVPGFVLAVAGLVLLALAPISVWPSTFRAAVPPTGDLILISLDATRADRLGAYGGPPGLTPALDRLAAEGEVFERAYSQEPWTLTSHMSMLTGLYPDVHGLDFGRALAPQIWTVPERLRDAGYRTAASVYDCFLLSPRFGYAAGFDRYEVDHRRARERCEAAADWLVRDARPGWLFLHLYDPHSDTGTLPYESSPRYRERFAPGADRGWEDWVGPGGASESLREVNEGQRPLSSALRKRLVQLYDAQIAETDAAVGVFLDRLREAGRYDDALLIVVADHGEALGEAGHFMHERLQEETLHVPLIVKWPRGWRAGERRAFLTETTDLAPTLLRAAGLSVEEVGQGVDLADTTGPARDHAFHRSGPDYAITTEEQWRLLYRFDPKWGVQPTALRRAGREPGDGPDLREAHPEVFGEWSARIERLHRALALLAARFAGGSVRMGESDEALLRSLGYVQ